MVAPPSDEPMTAAELFALPDDGNAYALSRGKLVCVAPSA